MLRDQWCDEAFFKASLKETEEVLEMCLDDFAKKKRPFDLSYASGTVLRACPKSYALGWSAEKIKPYYRRYLMFLSQTIDCMREQDQTWQDNSDAINITNIEFICWAIVFGECLGFSRADMQQMAGSIPAGIEQLVDRLLSAYQPERLISEVVKEKGKYKPLHTLLDTQNPEQQAKKLKAYLDSWPKRLGSYGPYGVHAMHETSNHTGYWCYEAAAVVIVCDIDDSSFRDHEFYPGELMSWRRGGWAAGLVAGAATQAVGASERHAQNLAGLKAAGFKQGPAELERYKPLFDVLCPHLPVALRQHWWNTLVDSVWEECEEYGFTDALSEAANVVRLAEDYGSPCLLHVDWKDLDSAIDFGEALLQEHGLGDGFEYDPTENSVESSDSPVATFFKALNEHLRPQGYAFVEIDTGGDNHLGVIADEETKKQIMTRASALEMIVR